MDFFSKLLKISGTGAQPMDDKIRAFIAIELGDDVHGMLKAAQDEIIKKTPDGSRGVSWVKAGNIHLTLKFLGDIDTKDIGTVSEAIEKSTAGLAPFNLAIGGAGAFPTITNPRVIWVGVGESAQLLLLQENIDNNLAAAGYPKEEREFKPHLTLGRVKIPGAGRAAGKAVAELKTDTNQIVTVSTIVLFKSVLKPAGAEYSVLKRVALKGR